MAETPENIYIFFDRALRYVLSGSDKLPRKTLAADAEISVQYLGQVLNRKNKKKASIKSQKNIAKAAGYTYKDFLELGHALIVADELGSRTILFRLGLKYIIEGMGPDQRNEELSQSEISNSKIMDFLDGADSLTESEQRQFCKTFSMGNYEHLMSLGRRIRYIYEPGNEHVAKDITPEFRKQLKVIDGGNAHPEPHQADIDPEKTTHEEIISHFEHKDWARRINALLLKIEKSSNHRKTVEAIIGAIADQVDSPKKQQNDQ